MASVDVVVPCYNYARYLPRCIQSALSQEGVDVRVLIIDDCSTDDTPAVGSALAAQDPRVEYRRHTTNLRHIATYNEGLLEWAKADYSLLLSADDLLAPNALSRATQVMDEHHGVHMTYGMALLFCEDADIAHFSDPADSPSHSSQPQYQIISGGNFVRTCIAGNPVPTPSAIVRTRMQQFVGGYSKTLPHTADLEMWMRFAAYGSIGVVPHVLAYKRTHSTNMSIQYADRPVGDYRERLAACRELLATHGGGLGKDAPSKEEINELIARQAFWSASRFADQGQMGACEEVLQFVQELWPDLAHTSEWKRLKLKSFVPSQVIQRVMPWMDAMRGNSSTAADSSEANVVNLRRIGWWPEVTR